MTPINDIFRGPRSLRRWTGAFMLITLLSCNKDGADQRPEPSRRVSFWRKDKQPYGTYIAYESLPHIFPNAEVSINHKDVNSLSKQDGKTAVIFIGEAVDLGPSAIRAMLNFIGQGNHVFLSAYYYSDTLLHTLDIRLGKQSESPFRDSLQLSVYPPGVNDSMAYAYPGIAYDQYIDSLDTKYATVLGRDHRGRPNLVRFAYKGGGSLMLHFAPLAFSNYFLMHKENKTYYDNVLSYIPENVTEVLWDESFRGSGENNFSMLSFFLKNKSLAMALWLLLLLFLLIYFFESKRRQRIVPVIAGLRNTSLEFVKTVGRLYYQRRDNQNLAIKMATYFQDHIRTKYNIPVHLSDPEFVDRLSYKTGISKDFLHTLTEDLLLLSQQGGVSDRELLDLNKKLDEFYKQV